MSDLIILMSDLIIYLLVISCVAGSSTIELVCFFPRQRAFWETGISHLNVGFSEGSGDSCSFFSYLNILDLSPHAAEIVEVKENLSPDLPEEQ